MWYTLDLCIENLKISNYSITIRPFFEERVTCEQANLWVTRASRE